MCTFLASGRGAAGISQSAVDGLGPYDEVATRTPVDHVAVECVAAHVEVHGQPVLDLAVVRRAAEPKNGAAVTDERGRASWLLPVGAPGLWELRLNGRRGTEVFSEVLRAELAEGRSPT